MNSLRYYAFYGSLRKGMENYFHYAAQLNYIKLVELKGYKMYSLGDYPYVVRSDEDDTIVAELFEITDPETEEMICKMELDADYILSDIPIEDTIFGIFLFENARPDHELVAHGDWCRHRKEAAF